MRAAFECVQGAGYFMQVPGMFHRNFTDTPNWTPLASRPDVTRTIDAMPAHEIVNAYSLAFFDRHLRAGPTNLIDASSSLFPEVILETKRGS